MDVSGISSMLNQTTATNNAAASKAESIQNSVHGLSSNSTDEELMEVLEDFESYFLEQIIKKMKDTFTDDEEKSSVASQYTDTFMDYAIEEVADILLEEVGGSMTQQLFEQMKRNYNIPTVDITTDAAEKVAVKAEE
jgi:flagellar protein FlgJ